MSLRVLSKKNHGKRWNSLTAVLVHTPRMYGFNTRQQARAFLSPIGCAAECSSPGPISPNSQRLMPVPMVPRHARSSFKTLVEAISAEETAAREASDAKAEAEAEATRQAAAEKAKLAAEEAAKPKLEVFPPRALMHHKRVPSTRARVHVGVFWAPVVYVDSMHGMFARSTQNRQLRCAPGHL